MAPTRVPPIRRLARAAVISLLLSLALGGVLGFAAAEPASDALAPGLVFGVPAPRFGDAAEYEVRLRGPDDPDSNFHLAHFEWLESRVVRDAAGNLRRVNDIEYSNHRMEGSPGTSIRDTLSLDALTNEVVLLTEYFNSTWVNPHGDLLNRTSSSTYRTARQSLLPGEDHYHPVSLLCGLFSELQGQALAIHEPTRLFRDCSFAGSERFDYLQNATFVAQGQDRIGDRVAVRFHRTPAQGGPAARVWFAEDIPYPLRYEVERDDGAGVVDIGWLTRFAAGTAPLARTPVEDADPAPALALSPRRPWGPEDGGVDHPFPLSGAWQGAIDSPTFSAFRDFLAAHPAAASFESTYAEGSQDHAVYHTWRLRVADADAGFGLCATQTTVAPFQNLLDAGPAVPTQEYRECGTEYVVPLEPALQPAELPTVASLLARWRFYASEEHRDRTPNAWNYYVPRCSPRPCEGNPGSVLAGHARSELETDPPYVPVGLVEFRILSNESHLRADERGRTVGLRESVSVWQDAANRPPLPPFPGTSSPQLASVDARHVPLWAVPEETVLFGAGLLAVLVGLGYYLWPLAKAGGLALFTRLERPKALDHPVRNRIVHLVQAEPGLHFLEISRRLGLARGTLDHHLKQLVKIGVLTEVRGPGYACYFAAGRATQRAKAAAPLLRAPGARAVLDAIRRRPGATVSGIAAALEVTPATVHYHVDRLSGAGLVTAQRAGGEVRLSAVPLET